MKIKIIAVEIGKGTCKTNKPYEFLDVTYKNLSFDKTETKKVMPFGAKEVFATLKAAQNGEVYTLQREKDEAGYWQWIGIVAGDVELETTNAPSTGTPAPAKSSTPAKSTFETPEERAKKQVYIVRQSSVASAVDLLKTEKKVPTVAEVIEAAKQFEAYVFGVEAVAVANPVKEPVFVEDDDIPM